MGGPEIFSRDRFFVEWDYTPWRIRLVPWLDTGWTTWILSHRFRLGKSANEIPAGRLFGQLDAGG